MREYISLAVGAAFVYFMLVMETIYGERNADKIDEWITDFFDWIYDKKTFLPMYSNAQSYEDMD